MRSIVGLAFIAALVVAGPRDARAQSGSIDGFGSLRVNDLSSASNSFGGKIAVDLGTPGIQLIGEAGRISNLLPTTTTTLLDFSPVKASVSAFYGEGGLRLSPAPNSPVHPYVEGSLGMARMNVNVSGLGTTGDVVARAALGFLSRTEPIGTVGGGVVLQGGPVLVDLGYRYKQVLSDSAFTTILGNGERLAAHQVRVGLGFRF